MLRIGKNPNENEQPDKQDAYSTPRSYAPAQTADPQAKPAAVEAGSSRALTESESLAVRHSESGRMMSSTLLSLRPSAPPG